MREAYALVVVGTSWGGLNALSVLLSTLPSTFPLPIAVVQHRGRDATSMLRDLLQDHTRLIVREAEDKDPVIGGVVYIAPPDYHLLLDDDNFALSVDPPVRFSRPSIDVTFGSAADAYGPRLVGLVLTGANDDGARGLSCVVERGGLALVQAPDTAESPVMPLAALRAVPAAEVVRLDAIGARLAALANVAPVQPLAGGRRTARGGRP